MGDHEIEVKGLDGETLLYGKQTVKIEEGKELKLTLPLASSGMESLVQIWVLSLENYEEKIKNGAVFMQDDVEKLEAILLLIKASDFSYVQLIARAEYVLSKVKKEWERQQRDSQIQEITKEIEDLRIDYNKSRNTRRNLTIAGWTSLGIGVVAGGLSILFFILSDSSYTAYNQTASTSDALRLKSEVQLYDTLKIATLAGASLCITISIPLFAFGPKPAKIENSIKYFEEELRKLNNEGK